MSRVSASSGTARIVDRRSAEMPWSGTVEGLFKIGLR